MNTNNKNNTYAVRALSEFLNDEGPFASFVSSMREAYRLCLRHKAGTPRALKFRVDKAGGFASLCRDVYSSEWIPRPSSTFIVHRPVDREIIAADFRDRIVHHYIVMRLEPLFEDGVLDDSMFSCRSGKGTLAAIYELRDRIRLESHGYKSECYVMSYDLQSFFMSIDRRRLYDELVSLVQERYRGDDRDLLLYLIRVSTLSRPVDRARRSCPPSEWDALPPDKSQYNLDWFLGLAIGNLTSQWGGNFYNAPFMRWLRSVGLAPVNYVDDFVHVSGDRGRLLCAMPHIRSYLKEELGLTLHPRKFSLQPISHGVKFLGAVIMYDRIYISSRTVSRCYMKMHWYNTVAARKHRSRARYAERYAGILNSYLGLMSHFATYNIRKGIASEVLACWSGYISFDGDFRTASAAPKYRRLNRARHNARRVRREDLNYIKDNSYERN